MVVPAGRFPDVAVNLLRVPPFGIGGEATVAHGPSDSERQIVFLANTSSDRYKAKHSDTVPFTR